MVHFPSKDGKCFIRPTSSIQTCRWLEIHCRSMSILISNRVVYFLYLHNNFSCTRSLFVVLKCIFSEVLFVSGLEFGGSKFNQMRAQLLIDHISGNLGNQQEVMNISRVIIAGNSVSPEVHDKEQHYKVSIGHLT